VGQKGKKVEISSRRRFFTNIAHNVGLGAMGTLLWAGYTTKAKSSPLTLRPPAALKEDDFLKTCIKCGLCAEACVNRPQNISRDGGKLNSGTLKMAKAEDSVTIGTPFFTPRDVPCFMCDDIPCVPVCPTGALDITKVTNPKTNELDFKMMDMGVAVVDVHSCIAFWGLQCDACYRACPLLDEAIKLEYNRNSRTGKHAFLEPVVNPDVCTGCGLCEKACVTEKPAIFVLPRDVAQGKAGDHYVKGWDKKDQQRVGDRKIKDIKTKDERSSKKPTDYLNGGLEY
jgi:ferredoxin-type protein NapG